MGLREQHRELVKAISREARKFYRLRYQMSNGGNLSARIPDTEYMLVKATDVDFSGVSYETLVVTDFFGKVIEGGAKPSKEALLHGALYRNLPQAGAIMHCHSPYATAWAAKHDSLELSTYHAGLKLCGCCPVLDTGSYAVPESRFSEIRT